LRLTRDEVRFADVRSVAQNLGGMTVASLVPYSFPLDPNQPGLTQRETTEEFTGRAIFDFKPTPDVLTYVSYSHGYRAGTYNSLAYQAIEQVYFVEPEKIDAFEVGVKSRFFGDRVQLNAAAFYYDYKNQQIAEIVGATSFLRSANGEVTGAEAEFVAQVTRTLRIDATLGLLDTRYDDNQRFTPTGIDIGGNEFPNAPNTSANLGFSWDVWRTSGGTLMLRGEAQYMGGYWFDPFNDYDQPLSQTNGRLASTELARGNPSYELYNARLTYQADKFAISAWGKNLTDKFYWVYGLNLNAFRQDYFTRGAPRTYGMEATYKF
jgi:iron complex outermembrane recepter protein